MNYDELIDAYSKLDVKTKRSKILEEIKFLISILQKICKDRNISYNELKCKEVLSLNDDAIEDEYLESLFSYVELLKELIGSYFYAKESVDRE